MRVLALGLLLMIRTVAIAQQPTEDEIGRAVIAAQRAVAEEFKVPEEHIKVVGKPTILPDHFRFHKKQQIPQEAAGDSNAGPYILIDLNPGPNELACGQPKAFVQGEEVDILTGNFRDPDTDRIPFSPEECKQVLRAIDSFFGVAFDYEKGRDRFLPFMSERLDSFVTRNPPRYALSTTEHRNLVASVLDTISCGVLLDLEGIEFPEPDRKPGDESQGDEEESIKAAQAHWQRDLTLIKKPLVDLGAFGEEHLAAVIPILKPANTVVDKHQVELSSSGTTSTSAQYHFQWFGIELSFILDGGHLKFTEVEMRD